MDCLKGLVIILFVSCHPHSSQEPIDYNLATLGKSDVYRQLNELTRSPHPLGSPRQKEISDWLLSEIPSEWEKSKQEFTATTPNPLVATSGSPLSLSVEKSGYNILASRPGVKDCWVLVGSHYDTKPVNGVEYVGANDGASTTMLLLQLAHFYKDQSFKCGLGLIWFDGEEPVLPDWDDGIHKHPLKQVDNTYGSRHFVERLDSCGDARCWKGSPVSAFVLLDMLGSHQLRLTPDLQSTPSLAQKQRALAEKLQIPIGFAAAIQDDHIPFLKAGIPAVNIIDFNNTQFWHRAGDNVETLSLESLNKSFKLAQSFIFELMSEL